ncbi:Acetyl-CoA carboxylase [Nocardia seriolae]|uniref:Acetyl-CoA carboxylase n=1 Tax=Nocardia seriolae TaxID=37332 RepID=A0ABC8B2Y7_9NOCA|nr:Acetyl-CoA carboxylase [Nocardia seriolae]GEM23075.1 pyruvate carboxylase [Nocardia seriolae NBRC 15557]BEK86194.1 pyruvate carboxylase [Nocardia seriolae]BEK97873.1 pyruvate carboxylase [Nocardia seriolae]GAM45444.1 pyruvate carboxylase [Nocardia seriolae]
MVRTARELGYETAVMHTGEDSGSLAVRLAERALGLPGSGAAGYLDVAAVVAAAAAAECGPGALVHPGYGFLSESAEFAAACAAAGLTFVGPSPEVLGIFGDKVAARAAAERAGVTVLPATPAGAGADEIAALLADHPDGVMVKAAAGGGGRGMRSVTDPARVAEAVERCRAEALAGFGDDRVYAEALVTRARHIEVQVVADGVAAVALGDRDCSVQRRRQKLVEIAPAPDLPAAVRDRVQREAVLIAEAVGCRGVITVEFLVEGTNVWFLEVNPRLQVEHTVTEAVTGVDLVALQLELAQGATLAELDLPKNETRGYAVQARVNAELLAADGTVLPSTGVLGRFDAPTGAGVRVDTAARVGMRQGVRFDSLLAKIITHAPTHEAALRRCSDALAETVIEGVDTNLHLLRAVLAELRERGGTTVVTTDWFEQRLDDLRSRAETFEDATPPRPTDSTPVVPTAEFEPAEGEQPLRSPMGATVVSLAEPGIVLAAGAEVAVLEAMKMQHVLRATEPLRVLRHAVAPGDVVDPHAVLVTWVAADHDGPATESTVVDLDSVRADLAEVLTRHETTLDARRETAVAKRHRLGRRTARENITDLVDPESFVEYGALAVAAQRSRRSLEDLIANTPADGLIAGLATVNADRFGPDRARALIMSSDYTVLAGTQGMRNHAKTDRMLELAREQRLPVVFFTEGGGGRPGDTDHGGISGLDVTTFRAMGALSGKVPLIGIVSGRCFAGNAALLGMCDVVIATPDANIGMGGPAMIEGGGLGVYAPEDIGPVEVQRRNGVIHVVAADEAEAVAVARRYLSYFQGAVDDWEAPDPRLARHVVPENRLHAYDIRAAIESVVDLGSSLELRRDWGVGVVTALVRVEGRPFGLIANDCHHLGGAIDAPAADKLSAFLQLCGAHGLPIVSLCDTPGFMVGPDAEKEATVTKFSRLFIDSAALEVPFGTVILRKGYGLGAPAMAAGSFRAPRFVIAWPTGEIGGMGLEGAVRLGFAKELAAIEDPAQRQAAFDALVKAAYDSGKALTAATVLELDDVIDPADTRRWLATLR